MKVVVVSPHLDDAVLSVGATMNSLVRRGIEVALVTIFAGNIEQQGVASYWDAGRGVRDKQAVLAARRREDAAAASVLGVQPFWLQNDDSAYVSPREPETIWAALSGHLVGAAAVLVPGWPLTHADHRFATNLVVGRAPSDLPVLFYTEMPYGAHPVAAAKGLLTGRRSAVLAHALGGPATWHRTPTERGDFVAKWEAAGCYAGELELLGRDARFARVYDCLVRREWLACAPDLPVPAAVFGGRA